MSDLPTDERERLDAILDAARDYFRASDTYTSAVADIDYSADYYLDSEARDVVRARERFGRAMDAWLDAKLAAMLPAAVVGRTDHD